jgi:hypothetical protein
MEIQIKDMVVLVHVRILTALRPPLPRDIHREIGGRAI